MKLKTYNNKIEKLKLPFDQSGKKGEMTRAKNNVFPKI